MAPVTFPTLVLHFIVVQFFPRPNLVQATHLLHFDFQHPDLYQSIQNCLLLYFLNLLFRPRHIILFRVDVSNQGGLVWLCRHFPLTNLFFESKNSLENQERMLSTVRFNLLAFQHIVSHPTYCHSSVGDKVYCQLYV
jgi:hypothetical protein